MSSRWDGLERKIALNVYTYGQVPLQYTEFITSCDIIIINPINTIVMYLISLLVVAGSVVNALPTAVDDYTDSHIDFSADPTSNSYLPSNTFSNDFQIPNGVTSPYPLAKPGNLITALNVPDASSPIDNGIMSGDQPGNPEIPLDSLTDIGGFDDTTAVSYIWAATLTDEQKQYTAWKCGSTQSVCCVKEETAQPLGSIFRDRCDHSKILPLSISVFFELTDFHL